MTIASRVRETTTVEGVGNATMLGAAAGYVTFASLYPNGTWVPYTIVGTNQFEEGFAPVSAGTLQRSLGRVFFSSNAGQLVNFTSGTKTVDGFVGNHELATRFAAERQAAATGGTDMTATNALLTNIDADVGALDSAAAGADGTGNYSVIAALKRGLLNWAAALAALGANAWRVSGFAAIPTQTFTRPADTTTYAAGDLIANSTTAGSVVPVAISVARVAAGSFLINRVRLSKSSTGVTGASFRVHLFNAQPAVANGDNGALLTSGRASYIGRVDLDMTAATIFNDGCAATADAGFLVALASGQTVWALIEARGAYAPASGETFALTLEVAQN